MWFELTFEVKLIDKKKIIIKNSLSKIGLNCDEFADEIDVKLTAVNWFHSLECLISNKLFFFFIYPYEKKQIFIFESK